MPNPATTSCLDNRLRELREAAGETSMDVAQMLGFRSTAQVERWERGANIPTPRARALATHYKVSISYLLRDENGDEGKAA